MNRNSKTIIDFSPEEKRVLLAELILKKAKESNSFPTSFAQERLWFLNKLEPQSPAYNIPVALRLEGSLDVKVLERSLNEILRRHDVLRTRFSTMDGQPVQIITPPQTMTLPVIDLSKHPKEQRETEALNLAGQERRKPFDLDRGPLLRVSLLYLDEREHVLLLTLHRIVSDGWSMKVLYRELTTLYQAFSSGRPSPLPELPIQYADFAYWQRGWLQGEFLRTHVDYWKSKLRSSPPILEIPTDHPRPSLQSFRGARQSLLLPQTLYKDLIALSQRSGVTLFMTLLAAFKTLLHWYTGQEDIVVGSSSAGRTRTETEELIGYFINTLVLRTGLSGNITFRELLGRVREVVRDAYAHQDLPFEKIVEELGPERSLSHTPLFQVMFSLQDVPIEMLELPGLTLSHLEIEGEIAKFDLTLNMFEGDDGLGGVLVYNTDLFEDDTIIRMLSHFKILLEGIVANPDEHLSKIPLFTESERQRLSVEWNHTQTDYEDLGYVKDLGVHELFERQVERTPDALAVVFENQQLTYHELNLRANQLAHYLRKRNVGPEALIGICLDRSLEMVVGLLGILKAGGAYLPLDPEHPPDRLAFMLEDAQVSVLLTKRGLLEKLPEQSAKVVYLDSDWDVIAQENEGNPASKTTPENTAYVIYTSGSDGSPKGVLGLHRGAVNPLAWMWKAYPFAADEVCCQKTSLNFVDSVWEIFGPLLQGVRIVIIPEKVVNDPYRLVNALATYQVTRIVLLPSSLRSILDTDTNLNIRLPNLKYWFCSGEDLTTELAERFLKIMPQSTLLNIYSSPEVSAGAICYETRQENTRHLSLPDGSPKGVLGLHRGAVNPLAWMWKAYPFAADEVCCQKTSLNFVDSVWEIFGPLLQGVRIVIIPEKVVNDPYRLVNALATYQVTRIVLLPSSLRSILDTDTNLNIRLPNLKYWFCSGEDLTTELAERFLKIMPQSTLLNIYSSPEVSAGAICYETRQENTRHLSLPIGRPIANTKTYLLDQNLNPVPIGITGELHIGGAGLARGYLNRPGLTAEKFIANPFSNKSQDRLYKTGDLGRYLPDGNIELLGRIDRQVKIRGFGVEPGELEVVLGGHPAVRQAAVTARENIDGDKGLVVYIVAERGERLTQGELNRFLKGKLPGYMLPSAMVKMDAIPRTPNGKVDFQALPGPDETIPDSATTFVASRDTLELKLKLILEKVLGIRPIGMQDNFFDRGGHSLLAVDLFSQIEKAFGKNLPLATLFQAPTIQHLADVIRQEGWNPSWSSLVAVQPGGSKPPFFCVPGFGGNVIHLRDLGRHLNPDQPLYGLQSRGLDGSTPPYTRVEDMAAHYIKEIRTLQPEGPYFLGGLSGGGKVAYEMAQQLHLQGQKVAFVALFDTYGPGYPEFKSNFISFYYKFNYLLRRIESQIENLFLLGPKEELFFFLRLIKGRIQRIYKSGLDSANLRVRQANIQAFNSYTPQPYPGRVTLFRASKQPKGCYPDPNLGWDGLAVGELEIQESTGYHLNFMAEPRIRFLVEKLKVCLAASAQRAQ